MREDRYFCFVIKQILLAPRNRDIAHQCRRSSK